MDQIVRRVRSSGLEMGNENFGKKGLRGVEYGVSAISKAKERLRQAGGPNYLDRRRRRAFEE